MTRIIVTGKICAPFVYDHESHGENFYRATLEVPRLSGSVDLLPIIVREGQTLPVLTDCEIVGEIRTRANRREDGFHIDSYVFVYNIEETASEGENEARVEGVLSKEPTLRETPFGRTICDLMIKSKRRKDKSDLIPCVAWGKDAVLLSRAHKGDRIQLSGRWQSRTYEKNGEQTTYEVSVREVRE